MSLTPGSANEYLLGSNCADEHGNGVSRNIDTVSDMANVINNDIFNGTPGHLEGLLEKKSHYLKHAKYSKQNEPIFHLQLMDVDSNKTLKARFITKGDSDNLKISLFSGKWTYSISKEAQPLTFNYFSENIHLRSDYEKS